MKKKPTEAFADLEGDLPIEGADEDTRLNRTAERYEESRQAERREAATDARGPTKAELIRKFSLEMYHNVVPDTPSIPGYHTCWVSTTNNSDSPQRREALGYERVRPEDLPGMEHITLTQGIFAGCIGLQELVLYKLPLDLWKKYMEIAHNERPYEQEEKIRDAVRYVQETAREGGSDVYLGSGTAELLNSRRRRSPTFSE